MSKFLVALIVLTALGGCSRTTRVEYVPIPPLGIVHQTFPDGSHYTLDGDTHRWMVKSGQLQFEIEGARTPGLTRQLYQYADTDHNRHISEAEAVKAYSALLSEAEADPLVLRVFSDGLVYRGKPEAMALMENAEAILHEEIRDWVQNEQDFWQNSPPESRPSLAEAGLRARDSRARLKESSLLLFKEADADKDRFIAVEEGESALNETLQLILDSLPQKSS